MRKLNGAPVCQPYDIQAFENAVSLLPRIHLGLLPSPKQPPWMAPKGGRAGGRVGRWVEGEIYTLLPKPFKPSTPNPKISTARKAVSGCKSFRGQRRVFVQE